MGSEGARLYLEKTFGRESREYRQAVSGDDGDKAAYLEYIRSLIAELEVLYASSLSREEKLQKKEEIIRASQARFEEIYDTLFQSDNYRDFSKLPVNNAYLELYRLYYEEDHYFQDLYNRSGRNLPRFISAVKTLKPRRDPRARLEQALGLK